MNWQNPPADIMTTILYWVLNTEPVVVPPLFPTYRYKFMLICRAWTHLINSSPFLWSNVLFLPVETEDPGALLHLARRWISRTFSVLVSIKLDGNFPFANRGREATYARQIMFGGGSFCPVEHILLPCAGRLTSLMCTIATNRTISAFMKVPAGTFPNLRDLDLVLINEFDDLPSRFDKADLDDFHVFEGCDALRNLGLHLTNEMRPLQLNIPWKQITTVDLATKSISPSEFRTILRRATSLSQGVFFVQFTARTNESAKIKLPKRVRAPALCNLVLCVMHPSVRPDMLESIELPALEHLRIELLEPEVGWMLRHYLPILRASPILKTLSLAPHTPRIRFEGGVVERTFGHRHIPDTEILDFFSSVPNIQELRLPLAIQLSIPILDQMSDGRHLSQLRGLEVGARCNYASYILSMVHSRNELLTDPRAVPNRSAETSRLIQDPVQHVTVPLSEIGCLLILVENGEKEKVEAETLELKHRRLCVGVKVKVEGREERLFYHPK